MQLQTSIAVKAPVHQGRSAADDLEGALTTVGSTHLVARGTELFAEGAPAECWYQVRSGMIRLCKLMPDGRRQIEAFLMPGNFFGFEPGNEHSFAAEGVCDSVVAVYRRSRIDQMVSGSPVLARRLLGLAISQLHDVQQRLVVLGRKTAIERLAYFMLEMLDRSGGIRIVNLPMSRSDIADYLGLTTETVSRVISTLRQKGLLDLVEAHRVIIRDREALEEISDGCL